MKNHLQDFKRFSVNENRFDWDPDQQMYTLNGEPLDIEFDHCYGVFEGDDFFFYTFDVHEAAEELAEAAAAMSGTPELRLLSMRPVGMQELLDTIGMEDFKRFLDSNRGMFA